MRNKVRKFSEYLPFIGTAGAVIAIVVISIIIIFAFIRPRAN